MHSVIIFFKLLSQKSYARNDVIRKNIYILFTCKLFNDVNYQQFILSFVD